MSLSLMASINMIPLFIDTALTAADDDLSVKLDDWPASGNKLRSPKYRLAKDDNIFVRLIGPHGMGNDKIKVKVTSESDTAGITVDLAEIEPGVYVNKAPTKPLRLGDTSGAQQSFTTIKVIDEEVLTFNLIFNGTDTGKFADVMVDKAEFAGAGTTTFWLSSTGDRETVRTGAITNARCFSAGDGFNDLTAGVKYAGANHPNTLEADIYHFSSHGAVVPQPNGEFWGSGILVDDNSNLIIDPATGIDSNSDWNNDVEWVVHASCSQIDWRGAGGKESWLKALKGNPRAAHGILGSWDGLNGDLRAHYARFWEFIQTPDGQGKLPTLVSGYIEGMERTNPPQPWAMMYYSVNEADKLKYTTRDDPSGTLHYASVHIEPKVPHERASASEGDQASEGTALVKTIDSGNGRLRFKNEKSAEKVEKNLSKRVFLKTVDLARRKPAFAKTVTERRDGAVDFSTKYNIHSRSGLTKNRAAELAFDEIKREFPEVASNARLRGVGTRYEQELDSTGKVLRDATTGYVVQFELIAGDVPVQGDYIIVSFFGDKVAAVTAKCHVAQEASAESKAPIDIEQALTKSLQPLKRSLEIKGDYEISDHELCYVNPEDPSGREKSPGANYVPAWRISIKPDSQGGRLRNAWIDAVSGEFIGSE